TSGGSARPGANGGPQVHETWPADTSTPATSCGAAGSSGFSRGSLTSPDDASGACRYTIELSPAPHDADWSSRVIDRFTAISFGSAIRGDRPRASVRSPSGSPTTSTPETTAPAGVVTHVQVAAT